MLFTNNTLRYNWLQYIHMFILYYVDTCILYDSCVMNINTFYALSQEYIHIVFFFSNIHQMQINLDLSLCGPGAGKF